MHLRRLLTSSVLLLVAALVALVVPAVPAVAAAPAPDWDSLGVPYVDPDGGGRAGAVRFGDGELPFTGRVWSVAASRRAAYVLRGRTLVVVPADGAAPRVLDRRLVGLPLADPLGRHAFWTARTDQGLRVLAYDDVADRVARGPVVRRQLLLTVDGDRAYLSGVRRGLTVWTAGRGVRRSDEQRELVVAARDGVLLRTSGDDAHLVDGRGEVTRVPTRFWLSTFSPDGEHLAASGRRVVYDVVRRATVRLDGLAPGQVTSQRWTPAGGLVVGVGRTGDDANRLHRYLCEVDTGDCEPLPGDPRLFHEPPFDSSPLGVLLRVVPFE